MSQATASSLSGPGGVASALRRGGGGGGVGGNDHYRQSSLPPHQPQHLQQQHQLVGSFVLQQNNYQQMQYQPHVNTGMNNNRGNGSALQGYTNSSQQFHHRSHHNTVGNGGNSGNVSLSGRLSLASASSSRNGVGGDAITSTNNSSVGRSVNSRVDEAYRRLGHRLSLQAHGEDESTVASFASNSSSWKNSGKTTASTRLRVHKGCGFTPYEEYAMQKRKENEIQSRQQLEQQQNPPGDRLSYRGEEDMSVSNSALGASPDSRIIASRIKKVAKTDYDDHGAHHGGAGGEKGREHQQRQSHGRASQGNLLKSLTYEAKEKFRKWQDTEPPHQAKADNGPAGVSSPSAAALPVTVDSPKMAGVDTHTKKSSSGDPSSFSSPSMSPHHYAEFSHLDLGVKGSDAMSTVTTSNNSCGRQAPMVEDDQYPAELSFLNHQPQESQMGPPVSSTKGLLSAVMEGHSESQSADRSVNTMTLSISTKDSRTVASSIRDSVGVRIGDGAVESAAASRQSPASSRHHHAGPFPRGKCLTTPAEGVTNDGLDNLEGNLIVHENDDIRVPRKSLHTIANTSVDHTIALGGNRSAEFRVISLLGQGTFAQVFKCLHVPSGKEVAVKIVKNKAAYTRQAAVEIDVFRALQENNGGDDHSSQASKPGGTPKDYMVNLVCFFMHQSHLCLVFELLGLNLYEVLKKRQFRGLPLSVVRSIILQSIAGVKDLSRQSIVHCDLKPENILLVSDDAVQDIVSAGESRRQLKKSEKDPSGTSETRPSESASPNTGESCEAKSSAPKGKIKLIDFGSACFEGYTAHTYIQSRFYRSPEVLIGLPYDSAIDMWSLGCVAAELFLGLPILPGVHEHDQLGRISEMIANIPDWMLEQGTKSTKYYMKFVGRPSSAPVANSEAAPSRTTTGNPSPAPAVAQWRLKTQKEYISSLSENEIRKKGGLSKLEKQPGNRYFKCNRLVDILALHVQPGAVEDKELLPSFVHFLYGVLDPDPWKRFTAFQVIQHPFITGDLSQLRVKTADMVLDAKEENQANLELGLFWQPPWDPAICRRKLLNVQRIRERQNALRRTIAGRYQLSRTPVPTQIGIQSYNPMDESTILNRLQPQPLGCSPPKQVTSSPSTSASNQSSTPLPTIRRATSEDRDALGPSYGIVSSLSNLGHPGTRVPLVGNEAHIRRSIQLPSSISGSPKSFTGLTYGNNQQNTITEGDFANALQRPGVVPGLGTSIPSDERAPYVPSTGQIAGHFQTGVPNRQNPPSANCFDEAHVAHLQNKSISVSGGTQSTHPLTPFSMSEGTSTAAQHLSTASLTAQPFTQPLTPSMLPSNYIGGIPRSDTSSIALPDVSSSATNPQNALLYQQQQYAPHSQHPVIIQQHQLQQYSQMLMQPPSTQFQVLPGQQQMQQQQQQPIFLASAPGGGYYYMTTTAVGQPVILQPVGLLNHHQQQQQPAQQPQYQQQYGEVMPQVISGPSAGQQYQVQQQQFVVQGQLHQSLQYQQPNQQQHSSCASNGSSGHVDSGSGTNTTRGGTTAGRQQQYYANSAAGGYSM